jgi:predicted nucleic acid-binding protein
MTQVLIDTSVWIDYFAGKKSAENLDSLIDEQRVCVNKIILCELLPFLHEKSENELIDLLQAVPEIPLTINWDKIIEYQTVNVKNGFRRIGIPDLIILDNIMQNDFVLFSFDKHFLQMKRYLKFKMYET